MKTLLFAYRDVGAYCLKFHLENNKEVVGVVVSPDDKGDNTWCLSVRKIALQNGVRIFDPKNLKNQVFIKDIGALKPDIIFSCYYPKLIPKDILNISRYGAINLHGGLLPKYRGCFSGAWSIINGEIESGVTMHYMEEQADAGNIIAVKKVFISNEDTGFSLYQKVSKAAVDLFKDKYPDLKEYDKAESIPQVYKQAVYYDRKIPFNGKIEWKKSKREIYNFVRALYFPPFKPAFTIYKDKELLVRGVKEINQSEQLPKEEEPGKIVRTISQGGIIKAGDGYVSLDLIKGEELVPGGVLL